MQRRIRALIALAVLAAVTLSGCVWSGPSNFSAAKSYDGGALVIQPAPSTFVPIRAQLARFDLATGGGGSGVRSGAQIFGYVTVDPTRLGVYSKPWLAPRHRLAWVQFYTDVESSSVGNVCPPTSKQPTPQPPQMHVMIVDAYTGLALEYRAALHGLCGGGSLKPMLFQASQDVSIPWTYLGGRRVRASIPGCSILHSYGAFGDGNGPGYVRVTVYRYIGPCSQPSTTRDLNVDPTYPGDPPPPWTHAPIGALPNGSG